MFIFESKMKNSNGIDETRKRVAMAFETGRNPVSIKNVAKLVNKNSWNNIQEMLKNYMPHLFYSLACPIPPVMPDILPN